MEMDKGNQDLVDRFQEVVDRSADKMGQEKNTRRQKLIDEVEQQTQYLREMEEMLDEVGFFVNDSEDEEEEQKEAVKVEEQTRDSTINKENENTINRDGSQINEESKIIESEKVTQVVI